MKKLILYLCVAFTGIFTCSCEKDLEPNLYGVISPEAAFSTQAGIEAATVALYYELKQVGWGPYLFSDGSCFVMDEACTDEWTVKWAGWTSFINGGWTNTDAMSTGFYNSTAKNITRCTFVLEQIALSSVPDDIKNKYVPEIRALRAFFLYDLYRFYGPMPMILDGQMALNPDPNYKPFRPTAASVETFITDELRAAADALPVTQTAYGRITKGAALHYLLKLRMNQKQWQAALNVIDEIDALSYYSLEEDYAGIFSATNEGNRELIFVVTAEALEDYGNHCYANILPTNYKSPTENTISGWNGHRMPWAFYDTFDAEDTRRALIQATYASTGGTTVNLRTNGDVGPLPLKYGIDPKAIGTWAGNDKVMDRYAEVLLFKAEALNELNGPNAESVKLVNRIRGRAFGVETALPEQVLINEEFNALAGTPPTETSGALMVRNYQAAGAGWETGIDNTSLLSGVNCLHIKITKVRTGTVAAIQGDLQVRNESLPIQAGRQYTASFKIRSSSDVSFNFRAPRGGLTADHVVTLEAGVSRDIEFNLGTATSTITDGAIFFALGALPVGTELWIDAVKITALEMDTSQNSPKLVKLADFPGKDDLREWILKERGWEFWYEGKRRQDLIRMDKYMTVGRSVAGNFSDKNYLFPIPRAVMIENHNITPNPGY